MRGAAVLSLGDGDSSDQHGDLSSDGSCADAAESEPPDVLSADAFAALFYREDRGSGSDDGDEVDDVVRAAAGKSRQAPGITPDRARAPRRRRVCDESAEGRDGGSTALIGERGAPMSTAGADSSDDDDIRRAATVALWREDGDFAMFRTCEIDDESPPDDGDAGADAGRNITRNADYDLFFASLPGEEAVGDESDPAAPLRPVVLVQQKRRGRKPGSADKAPRDKAPPVVPPAKQQRDSSSRVHSAAPSDAQAKKRPADKAMPATAAKRPKESARSALEAARDESVNDDAGVLHSSATGAAPAADDEEEEHTDDATKSAEDVDFEAHIADNALKVARYRKPKLGFDNRDDAKASALLTAQEYLYAAFEGPVPVRRTEKSSQKRNAVDLVTEPSAPWTYFKTRDLIDVVRPAGVFDVIRTALDRATPQQVSANVAEIATITLLRNDDGSLLEEFRLHEFPDYIPVLS